MHQKRRFFLYNFRILSLILFGLPAYAQPDTATFAPVVITATRTARTLNEVILPMNIITQKTIEKNAYLRLTDVLQEQNGVNIANEHGRGVQLQGFDPAYTLILIDGEPVIGRTAGTLELSRIAVGNIKQIEIVKGPSSSLYGSDALAGVINIITKNPTQNTAKLNLQYGTNATIDAGLTVDFLKNKVGATLFLNGYQSQGYDLVPQIFGQTVSPFNTQTAQLKISYEPNKNTQMTISGKYFGQMQFDDFDAGTFASPILVNGRGTVRETTINPQIKHQINDQWSVQARYYLAQYATQNTYKYLNTENVFDSSYFLQKFSRPELQSIYEYSKKSVFTAGTGINTESVEATRYTSKKTFDNYYVFVQNEYKPNQKWAATTGISANVHSVYGKQISPKMAVRYAIKPKTQLNASVGRGFKAPDFRQLYLNFNNAIAGYTVLGAAEVPSGIARLRAQGQIEQVFIDENQNIILKAEQSWAYNVGIKTTINPKITADANVFYHDVSNLIETQTIARKTNGQSVFSYQNLSQVRIKGIEANANYTLTQAISLSAGYQFLNTNSQQALAQIKSGQVFRRNEAGQVVPVTRQDYGGLFNRSAHTANIKLSYQNTKRNFDANIRVIYRSKFGFGDANGNLILDDASEYAPGYALVNVVVSKGLLKDKLRLQAGVNNLLNYTDALYLPNLAGLQWFVGIRGNF